MFFFIVFKNKKKKKPKDVIKNMISTKLAKEFEVRRLLMKRAESLVLIVFIFTSRKTA